MYLVGASMLGVAETRIVLNLASSLAIVKVVLRVASRGDRGIMFRDVGGLIANARLPGRAAPGNH